MLFAHCVPRLTDQSTPEPEDAILNPPRIGLQTLSVIPTQKITRVWGNRAGISGLVGTLFLLSSYPKPPYPVSKRGGKGQKVQYLLSGLLKCQVCGNNFQMDFDKRQPKQSFYRCGSRRRGAKLCSSYSVSTIHHPPSPTTPRIRISQDWGRSFLQRLKNPVLYEEYVNKS